MMGFRVGGWRSFSEGSDESDEDGGKPGRLERGRFNEECLRLSTTVFDLVVVGSDTTRRSPKDISSLNIRLRSEFLISRSGGLPLVRAGSLRGFDFNEDGALNGMEWILGILTGFLRGIAAVRESVKGMSGRRGSKKESKDMEERSCLLVGS